MSGTPLNHVKTVTTVVTPELAAELLEHNQLNRPLSDVHVQRIARLIKAGKWKLNGDSIKISLEGDVLDGQHRLWAIIEAKVPVETVLVRGIAREAFATIDTIRRSRSGADTLAINGVGRQRQGMAAALTWLLRWQRGVMETYRAPINRIENSDIEEAFEHHPKIAHAVEVCTQLRRLCNVGILSFLYYIFANRNPEIADRMIETMKNPAGVGINDPFFRLRQYFTSDHHMKKDGLVTIALAIKAANAAHQGREVGGLRWTNQGKTAEEFPELEIGRPHERKART